MVVTERWILWADLEGETQESVAVSENTPLLCPRLHLPYCHLLLGLLQLSQDFLYHLSHWLSVTVTKTLRPRSLQRNVF